PLSPSLLPFFFCATSPPEIYTLSLHDALPISAVGFVDCRTEIVQSFPVAASARRSLDRGDVAKTATSQLAILTDDEYQRGVQQIDRKSTRLKLQSPYDLVCRLLLEKKKTKI